MGKDETLGLDFNFKLYFVEILSPTATYIDFPKAV